MQQDLVDFKDQFEKDFKEKTATLDLAEKDLEDERLMLSVKFE